MSDGIGRKPTQIALSQRLIHERNIFCIERCFKQDELFILFIF